MADTGPSQRLSTLTADRYRDGSDDTARVRRAHIGLNDHRRLDSPGRIAADRPGFADAAARVGGTATG